MGVQQRAINRINYVLLYDTIIPYLNMETLSTFFSRHFTALSIPLVE